MLIIPLIIALPPSTIGASKFFPKIELFLNNYPYLKLACAFWPIILIPLNFLYESLKSKIDNKSVSLYEINLLFKITDHVVGKKTERFGIKYASIIKQNNLQEIEEIFNEITQPLLQINELIEGVWQFFEATKSDKDVIIKVALAQMKGEYIEDFVCFYPSNYGPRSAIEELQDSDSCFSKAKKTRRIVIVDDIRKESVRVKGKRNFIVTRPEFEPEDGSIICYPVIIRNTQEIPFVISIFASQKNCFRQKGRERYEIILKRFGQRIALEYCLLKIKERVK